ncbi:MULTISPECIES: trypsin-like serine peptidase [unclassified Nocardioides]|uniref:trypsin-like serine peptidase n=1 Tax=unclassified Nocardioides TaxID=2615069 RepID=UPI000A565BFA|nr:MULTISPECIES: hypothetical protein [unclassified Nocardioides]
MRKSVVRCWAALSGVGLVASLLLVAPQLADASGALPERAATASAASALLSTDGVADYWTPARMRSAVPMDLDADGDAIAGSGPATGTTRARAATLTAPRSVGKLFFTTAQGNAVCSAAALNTAQKNVVITAGHCANSGGVPNLLGCSKGRYYTNFLFVPRYANGSAPDGQWVGTRAVTHQQWISECDAFEFDQALIEVAPRNGRNLVDVVGGNGVAWNFPAEQADINVWGWPAETPYDGMTVKRCHGTTTELDANGDAFLSCPMTGGASGGPWFVGMVGSNVGYIWAVTSRRTTTGPAYVLAYPIGDSIRTLLADARLNARTVASSSTTTSTTTSTSPTRAVTGLSVTPNHSVIGRGQLVVLRIRSAARRWVAIDASRRSARGPWTRVATRWASASGTVAVSQRLVRVGYRWYRVRNAAGRQVVVRVRINVCPLPAQRSAAVVDNTGCTGPTS